MAIVMELHLRRTFFLLLMGLSCPAFVSAQNSILYSAPSYPYTILGPNSGGLYPDFPVNITGTFYNACTGSPPTSYSLDSTGYVFGHLPLYTIPANVDPTKLLTVTNGNSGFQGGSSSSISSAFGTPGSGIWGTTVTTDTYSVNGSLIQGSETNSRKEFIGYPSCCECVRRVHE
jgi:hypothetical protein